MLIFFLAENVLRHIKHHIHRFKKFFELPYQKEVENNHYKTVIHNIVPDRQKVLK